MTNETQTHPTLEILMSWGETPLRQDLVTEGTSVTIGEAGTFMVPSEIAPETLTLAEVEEGRWIVRPVAGLSMMVTQGSVPVPLLSPIVLDANTEIDVQLGEFRFSLRTAEAVETTPRAGVTIDRDVARFVGGSILFHLVLLAMFLLVPPNASALNSDLSGTRAEYIRVQLNAVAEMQPEPVPVEQTSGMEGTGGEASPSPSAGDGEPGPVENTGRSQMRRGENVGSTTPVTAETVSDLGTFQALRALSEGLDHTGSPFGDADDTGLSWLQSRGDIGGDGIFGGLDMNRTFRGTCTGPRCGEGVARLGDILDRDGIPRGPRGDDVQLRDRDDSTGTPDWHAGPVQTVGGLTRTDIQRVVRRHKPEVRFCYEQALVSRPDLEGRVAVRFIVQPDGHVSTAVEQSSSVGSRVSDCVTDAVSRWGFPQTAGITAVTYPFVFHTN